MIQHENVQVVPRLPFKYYSHDPLTSIDVAPHWHQGIELNYLVAGGTLKFVTDGQTREYHPGDIWAVNRRAVHSATGLSEADWDEFGLIIDDDFLQSQLSESVNWRITLTGPKSQRAAPAAYEEIRTHLLAMHDLLTKGVTDITRLSILSHFYALLVVLQAHFTVPLAASDVNPNPSLTDTVMTVISRNYADPQLTGEVLAQQFHVSLTTLNQQFRVNLQMSVNRYIRLVRLMAARKLLLETNRTVASIAGSSGFSSEKTLTRNFKVWKGMTPTEYRQAFARYHKNGGNGL
jgi:AraC-like DNA-binding protein